MAFESRRERGIRGTKLVDHEPGECSRAEFVVMCLVSALIGKRARCFVRPQGFVEPHAAGSEVDQRDAFLARRKPEFSGQ